MQRFIRILALLALDYLIVYFSFWLAYTLSFPHDFIVPPQYAVYFTQTTFIWPILFCALFALFGVYRSLWKYTSIDEAFTLFGASVIATILTYLLSLALEPFFHLVIPKRTPVIAGTFVIVITCGLRVVYRIARNLRTRISGYRNAGNLTNLMIIGAGDAGSALIKELSNANSTYNILAILDDDKKKVGSRLHGVPIVGTSKDIRFFAEKYDIQEIIIAIPSASYDQLSKILEHCPRGKYRLRIMPRIFDDKEEVSALKQIREIHIEDLLIRDEVSLDHCNIRNLLYDKVVMVTGGGGSIGSELCRQIMEFEPKLLLIFDINENNAYELMYELNMRHKRPEAIKVCIGSVQDERRVDKLMNQYKPVVVFHAAAYKHVPLMEETPELAVENNVFGSYNMACLSIAHGVQKFIFISTDKAVNPTNVMGATKRVTELIMQAMNQESETDFVSVRFGNVLGSNGSVVPLFRKQIAMGGPITLTHPDITRYFMTITEAVSLVMEAASMAHGGEIFILDMGNPIKILDLAKNMIRLSGLVPDQDIKIEFVGLRPGEKLYEELVMSEEGVDKSSNSKIFIAHPSGVPLSKVNDYLYTLQVCMLEQADVKKCLMQILPNYKPVDC